MSSSRFLGLSRRATSLLIIGLLLQVASATSARAMPMFARKYKVDCAMCHAAVPRLNFTGFKFRAAGFRMAWEIGKPQADTVNIFENYTAFTAIISASGNITSNAVPPGVVQVNAGELDAHPLTGSWGQSWSSSFEFDGLPDRSVNLNQAFIGYTAGSADSFWNLTGGVFPNFLGSGSFARSMAVSVPLILTTSASNSTLDTLFNWANPRAAGVTGSYWFGDAYLSASIRDRLNATPNGLDALGTPSSNHMGDILISLTQFYDHTGSGSAIGLAYYKGQTRLETATGSGLFRADNFSHLIGSANYYITEHLNAFLGGGWGKDQVDSGADQVDQKLYSGGYYGGLEYFWGPDLAMGGRYDHFKTDLHTDGTDLTTGTLYLHYRPINQIIFATEYQFTHNGTATAEPGLDQSVLTLQATLAF